MGQSSWPLRCSLMCAWGWWTLRASCRERCRRGAVLGEFQGLQRFETPYKSLRTPAAVWPWPRPPMGGLLVCRASSRAAAVRGRRAGLPAAWPRIPHCVRRGRRGRIQGPGNAPAPATFLAVLSRGSVQPWRRHAAPPGGLPSQPPPPTHRSGHPHDQRAFGNTAT